MSLTLHYHPLSSFCWKVLVALYENDIPFTPHLVDFGNPEQAAAFKKLWPVGKFPVLRDERANLTLPESTVIIEYLDQHYPGRTRFLPSDADAARETRLRDRFYDLYVNVPMQKVVIDRLRPAGGRDPIGVEQARALLATAYGMIEAEMAGRTWAMGEAFSLADCAAAPALFYAETCVPFGAHANLSRYFGRLKERPSVARALREAEPYFHLFPRGDGA